MDYSINRILFNYVCLGSRPMKCYQITATEDLLLRTCIAYAFYLRKRPDLNLNVGVFFYGWVMGVWSKIWKEKRMRKRMEIAVLRLRSNKTVFSFSKCENSVPSSNPLISKSLSDYHSITWFWTFLLEYSSSFFFF